MEPKPETAGSSESQRRERFVKQVNAGYARLRADPSAWEQHLAERREWDPTLTEGPVAADRQG